MDQTSGHPEPEEEPFIGSVEKSKSSGRSRLSRKRLRSVVVFAALQLGLIALYTFASVYYVRRAARQSLCFDDPAERLSGLEILSERRKYIAYQDSPYAGAPELHNSEAWDKLIANKTVRVTKEELQRQDRTSLELPKGGHMAWLSVFHELHCLHFIRNNLFEGLSSMDGTEAEKEHSRVHANHCIEMLRSSAICRADASLITFKWADQGKPTPDLRRPVHTCVNWELFTNSLTDRFVDEDELRDLVNSYP